MTDLYEKMQVSPDPVQAEQLRRSLHARMADASRDDQGRSDLELDSGGHPDDGLVSVPELSDSPPPGDPTRRRRLLLTAAAAVIVVGAAALTVSIRRSDDKDPSVRAVDAPTTTLPARSSGGMWPQSSIEEVRKAQELADAGDPAYTWQVDPTLASDLYDEWHPHLVSPGAEIAERFLREELGWDQFLFLAHSRSTDTYDTGELHVEYLRCAPGETNSLYPTPAGGGAQGASRCEPTIDELRYETVRLDLSQLARLGPQGIWVVNRWNMTTPFAQADPNAAETEARARLEDFLRARVEGQGSERYVENTPLLYATTTGAPYERFEIELLSGPTWPYAEMEFTVRLFAEGGETVVEQALYVTDAGLSVSIRETTENGRPYYVFYHGEVTVLAAAPWQAVGFGDALTLGESKDARVLIGLDPLPTVTGCGQGPVPDDAAALARAIRSDLDLVVTGPVGVSIGGVEGMAMDITLAPDATTSNCSAGRGSRPVLTGLNGDFWARTAALDPGSRMRVYLVDVPEGSPTQVLAVAVVAPEPQFDAVVEAAAPIIESIEFHPGGS